jgi:hypothetical protein
MEGCGSKYAVLKVSHFVGRGAELRSTLALSRESTQDTTKNTD